MKSLNRFIELTCERASIVEYWFPKGSNEKPKITKHAIEAIVENLYLASLHFDESRPTQSRIMYVAFDDMEDKLHEFETHFDYIPFSKPLDFSPKNIARISQGLNYQRSILIVSKKTLRSKVFLIYGIPHVGPSSSSFQKHESGSTILLPDSFVFWCSSPGSIGMSLGEQQLILLEKSSLIERELNLYNPLIFQEIFQPELNEIAKRIHSDTGHTLTKTEVSATVWAPYVKIVDAICSRILEQKHGGAVIMLPANINSPGELSIKYPVVKSSSRIWDVFLEVLCGTAKLKFCTLPPEHRQQIQFDVRSNLERIRNYPDLIGHLSKLDGAVVIDKHLNLLGFGAEIKVNPSADNKVLLLDPKGKSNTTIDFTTYGTRHRSAIRFCKMHKNAVIFVFSQDGGTKMIFSKKRKTYLGQDINRIRYGLYFGF